jgi:hypothetical protein
MDTSKVSPRGRGVKAMDCNNLGRVFAPALMAWQDENETQDEKDKGLKDLVVLVEAFTSVVAQLILWAPGVWAKSPSLSSEVENEEKQEESGETETETPEGTRKRKRRERRARRNKGLLLLEEGIEGETEYEKKLICADVNYAAGVALLSQMMIVKLRHRMLLFLPSHFLNAPLSSSSSSSLPEEKKEKEKNKRLRVDEDGHSSPSSSSSSSSLSGSGSSLSSFSRGLPHTVPTLQSVYSDLKYQALIRFRQAAESGHLASSIELARLVFFGFLEG